MHRLSTHNILDQLDEIDELENSTPTRRKREELLSFNRKLRMHDKLHMNQNSNGPTIGVNDVEDWAIYSIEQNWFNSGLSILQRQESFLIPDSDKFKFVDWFEQLDCIKYTFFNSRCALVEFDDGYLLFHYRDITFSICYSGLRTFVDAWKSKLPELFSKPRNSVNWVYDHEGHEISVPLNYRPAIQSAYPWLNTPLNDYIDGYLKNDACVLILIGPPGTGKTTFIKNIIHRSNGDAKVAYNTNVLDSDQFFARFVSSDDNILVLEDADTFLSSRKSGNNMMHRFLNVSDGLISTSGKKIIFSTNLPNLDDVDSALMRPGRCYDVIEFRALNRDEATAVLAESGSDRQLQPGSSFTLAEIFNPGPHTGAIVKKKIGF